MLNNDKNFIIRQMNLHDLETAIEWAAQEGWNPGLSDLEAFYETDPNGFFIGEVCGEAVCCISVVAYDDEFGFLGFYIVKPEYRGNGYGYAIWQKGMEYLAQRNVGLDGVVAQQDNYKKSGFNLAYRNIRYEGTAQVIDNKGCIDAKTVPLSKIEVFDRQMFPANRTAFLNKWINNPEHLALCELSGDEIIGYAVLRPCRQGYKIGPLFAECESVALKLFYSLISSIPGEKFYLDVPEPNDQAVKLAENHGMTRVFETARMYTKNPPQIPLNKVFGVTTFELG